MRAALFALVVLGLTPATFGMAAAPGPNDDLQSDRVRSLSADAQQILTELKRTCDDLHLRFIGTTQFQPFWVRENQDFMDPVAIIGPTVSLGLKQHEQDFEFRQTDGRLTSYMNGLVDGLDENKVRYDKPDQPKWSKDQAIAIGTAFEKVFVGSADVTLGQPVAEYAHTRPNYYLGQWMISWPRVDSKGHPFYGDHVTIQIQEGFGPMCAGVFLSTPYAEEKGEPFSKSKATALAMEAADAKIIDRGFESYADGDTLVENKAEKADLIVVLPAKDLKVLGGHSTGIGRLAWVVWIRPEHSKRNTHAIYDDSYSIWVDAYNGNILGTEGWL